MLTILSPRTLPLAAKRLSEVRTTRNILPQFFRILTTSSAAQRGIDLKSHHHHHHHDQLVHDSSTLAAATATTTKNLSSRLIEHVPLPVQPYLRLARMDRPIGTWLLFWPCSWSIAAASAAGSLPDAKMLLLFGTGAWVMRGAGCTINDMWDRDIDAKVARTATRPISSGQISMRRALVFLAAQLSCGLAVLMQLNWYSVALGATSLGLVIAYPLAKRFTHWPQLVLGLTFNWGALLGYTACHGSLNPAVCLPLYAAGVCWTIVYDTIYAHQDVDDDRRIGIKSTALHFGERTKLMLALFGSGMIGNLTAFGYLNELAWPFYAASGLVAMHIASQIATMDVRNANDLMSKFISNAQVGLIIFGGIVLGILLKDEETISESSDAKVCQ